MARLRWSGLRFARVRVLRNSTRYVLVVCDRGREHATKVHIRSFGKDRTEARERAQLFVHDAWALQKLAAAATSKAAKRRLREQFETRLNDKALDLLLDP